MRVEPCLRHMNSALPLAQAAVELLAVIRQTFRGRAQTWHGWGGVQYVPNTKRELNTAWLLT